MNGYHLSFFTEQYRKHNGLPMVDWLLEEAKKAGVKGGTVISASEGYGQDGKIHSVHFFDLAEQPVTVSLIGEEANINVLLQKVRKANLNIFYVKSPVEFGYATAC